MVPHPGPKCDVKTYIHVDHHAQSDVAQIDCLGLSMFRPFTDVTIIAQGYQQCGVLSTLFAGESGHL
jgi:hypothetical protein